ncbi:NADH-quinone oxidoreductase subunit NuoE, partial [Neorhizobium sp. SHOUNA12A]|uniref:NADH-quinone oxidoreductase subunit NuoE n=2 Tax=unclassified Neorhizobium TaxID=2629175 RepID=UPI001FF1F131
MSVRRLAEDQVQPAIFAFNDENAVWAEATIRKYPAGRQQSAVIPLLMRAQEQDGWVTRAAIEFVANKLDMPYIRVLEVATFYTQFQLKPVGTRAHIQVCGTTPCMLRGAEDLMKVCQHKIHHDPFALNADGTLSWEEVECQGACVNAPMVIIFKDAYEDLTPQRLEEIIDAFEAGKGHEIKPGPQIDRIFSAPEGGPQTLNDEIKPVRTNLDPHPSAEEAAAAASVPPADAGRPKDTAAETDPKLKTPATAPAAAAANAKA